MLFILFTKRRYVLDFKGVVVVYGLNTTKLIFQTIIVPFLWYRESPAKTDSVESKITVLSETMLIGVNFSTVSPILVLGN